ncbi:MAG: hypothetical protein IT307_02750 [Chloroflexi bacterium]|nr:hypothetical protein [Chloroflexota bacterium]
MVSQYLEPREEYPGNILFFRVGSFYEVLFEDAELVARELGLKLGVVSTSARASRKPSRRPARTSRTSARNAIISPRSSRRRRGSFGVPSAGR